MNGTAHSPEIPVTQGSPPSIFVMVLPNRQIIPLEVEHTESGAWLATNPHILVHGIGETAQEAAVEFVEMARDQYEDYLANRASLAPHLLEELNTLIGLFGAPSSAA
jgi:hypothetical protein